MAMAAAAAAAAAVDARKQSVSIMCMCNSPHKKAQHTATSKKVGGSGCHSDKIKVTDYYHGCWCKTRRVSLHFTGAKTMAGTHTVTLGELKAGRDHRHLTRSSFNRPPTPLSSLSFIFETAHPSSSRPDMTLVVDWALKTSYLSIYPLLQSTCP